MLADTRKSPYAKAAPLDSRGVAWTQGFWKDVETTTFQHTVPKLQKMFEAPDISHVVENFRIAAGETQGKFDGTVFGDGDFYKWMESAMYAAVRTGNEELLKTIDHYIDLIGRAQQPDGYLSTKQIIGEREDGGVHRMGDINDFEVYNFGHLFTAAALYYRLTGKKNFLAIASKTADYLDSLYEEAKKSGEVQTAVCPSHYMGLIELYRATGEKKYLKLAKEAVELRDSVKNGLDDNQDRLKLREHREIIGHAVRANYLYAGVADLYMEEGDESYHKVLNSVWKDLLSRKLYITGGCGALYNGASPYGNFMHHQLIHQAYGYPYQLPNATAYNETCAGIGLVMWAYRMFLMDPKAVYFDIIERVLLNTTLAAVSLDGERFFYENMLERTHALGFRPIWALHRTDYITSYCCPPNLARCLAESSEYAYAISGNTIYTGIYGSSRAQIQTENGLSFVVEQMTEYPYDGQIHFEIAKVDQTGASETVSENQTVTLALRIPAWALQGEIQVQSETVHMCEKLTGQDAGTYHLVQIPVSAGAKVDLHLEMKPRFTAANDLVEETDGKAALECGPLVYCMETADLADKNISLSDLSFELTGDKDAESFKESDLVIMGRKVKALQGPMQYVKRDDDRSGLYRTLKKEKTKEIQVQLIPYFAWDNRSEEADANEEGADDEMRIWFPVQR